MIVDCHSHIWPSHTKLGEANGFLAGMDQSAPPKEHLHASGKADYSLVLGFVSNRLNAEIPNEFIVEYVRANRQKMIGFAGIDPTARGACRELRSWQEQGLQGLTLSPGCQGFHPMDSRVLPVYELAQELGMPIVFLQGERMPGSAVMAFSEPALLDEVARQYPELKIVISHLGFPWVEETFCLLAKHETVYTTVTGLAGKPWQAYRTLTLAHEYGVMKKLLFGSGYPTCSIETAVSTLYSLNKITLDSGFSAVPREQLRGIVERNALELLGLTVPGGTPATTTAHRGARESTAEMTGTPEAPHSSTGGGSSAKQSSSQARKAAEPRAGQAAESKASQAAEPSAGQAAESKQARETGSTQQAIESAYHESELAEQDNTEKQGEAGKQPLPGARPSSETASETVGPTSGTDKAASDSEGNAENQLAAPPADKAPTDTNSPGTDEATSPEERNSSG